jgi:DNA-binding GntR family transcriptional regulator
VTLLRNMIMEGELKPGSRIAESRLCTHFGVSRTPLREALKVLSAEGLVRLLPRRPAAGW